jgi:hypothetical protein
MPDISQTVRDIAVEISKKNKGRPRKSRVSLAPVPSIDATPERITQAKRNQQSVVHNKIRDASGFDTGRRRREVLGVLETLAARRCISEIQLQAGMRFLNLWSVSSRGPRITQRWDDTPRGEGVTASERIDAAQKAFRAAWLSVHQRLAPVLHWIVDTEFHATPPTIIDLGHKYQGAAGQEAARARGFALLHFTLDELSAHFRLISQMTLHQRRKELEELLRRR